MDIVDNILIGIVYILLGAMILVLVWTISIPFWSEKREYCKAWNEIDGQIVCVAKGIYFCLDDCN